MRSWDLWGSGAPDDEYAERRRDHELAEVDRRQRKDDWLKDQGPAHTRPHVHLADVLGGNDFDHEATSLGDVMSERGGFGW